MPQKSKKSLDAFALKKAPKNSTSQSSKHPRATLIDL